MKTLNETLQAGMKGSIYRVVYSPTEYGYATVEAGVVEWHHSAKRARLVLPGAPIKVVSPQDFHGLLAMHRIRWDAGL